MNSDKKDYGEVLIEGKIISSSWWGKMWCKNIENYSSLKNRLERGRTYIRQNTVKKLIISSNCAEAYVQGTKKEPYRVCINIKSIDSSKYNNILETCEKSIDSLEALMSGSFPKEYQQFFTDENYGLFPKTDEIEYKCSCPDYFTNLHMCKHIAATLYAIGNKLDEDPLIFFKLRGINLSEFSDKIIKKENDFVWENINSKSNRRINNDDISSLFGVEYENIQDEIDMSIIDKSNNLITKNDSSHLSSSKCTIISNESQSQTSNNLPVSEEEQTKVNQINYSSKNKFGFFSKLINIFKIKK